MTEDHVPLEAAGHSLVSNIFLGKNRSDFANIKKVIKSWKV